MFSQQYIDCSRNHSDYYVNTPAFNRELERIPRFVQFRYTDVSLRNAVVEFYNYHALAPQLEYRTTTTRGSLYTQSKKSTEAPLAATVAVPSGATYFRVRIAPGVVTRQLDVFNNAMFFLEGNGNIYQLSV